MLELKIIWIKSAQILKFQNLEHSNFELSHSENSKFTFNFGVFQIEGI